VRIARLLVPAVALACVAALSGCSSDDATTPVRNGASIAFSSMTPHVGQKLEMRVVHVQTGVEVGYAKLDPIASAAFTLSIPDVLVANETYYIDWYADLNGNGRYDDPPTDHAWRRTIIASMAPYTLSFVHDTVWTDIDFPATRP